MRKRKLGKTIEVSPIGYGCMGLSHGYGPIPEKKESIKLIRNIFELGCTFFDTAESYGHGENEKIVGEALEPFRNKVVIATKFGGNQAVDGKLYPKEFTPTEIRQHLEDSLRRLRTDYIDLYYQHRVSKIITVEEVAGLMGDLIKEGKIVGWGLSQATEEEIRRAHVVTPLAAIQSEYSMMERMFEKDVIPTCEELEIGFVSFSPLASGFLTGKVQSGKTYIGDDVRKSITRFRENNIVANQPLINLLRQYADSKGTTLAQISLAWMLHKKPFIVPIPGTESLNRMIENIGAVDVELSSEEFRQIEEELTKIMIYGNRTDEDIIFPNREYFNN